MRYVLRVLATIMGSAGAPGAGEGPSGQRMSTFQSLLELCKLAPRVPFTIPPLVLTSDRYIFSRTPEQQQRPSCSAGA